MKEIIELLNDRSRGKLMTDEEVNMILETGIINYVEPKFHIILKYFPLRIINIRKKKYAAYPLEYQEVTKLCSMFNILEHRDNLCFILDLNSWDHQKFEESAEDNKISEIEYVRLIKLREESKKDFGRSVLIDEIIKTYEIVQDIDYKSLPKDIKGNPRKLDNAGLFKEYLIKKLFIYLDFETNIETQTQKNEIIAHFLEILQNKKIIYDRKKLNAATEHIKYKKRVI